MKSNRKRILAVASGGGHWVQLLRLRPAFDGHDLAFLTTNEGYKSEVEGKVFIVTDANMWEKLKLLKMFIEVAWIILKFRPNVVVTTGAAPGFAAIMFGRLFGMKTIWIDSIANSEQLSSSGLHARRWAKVWLTQWEHLAQPEGPHFWGGVL